MTADRVVDVAVATHSDGREEQDEAVVGSFDGRSGVVVGGRRSPMEDTTARKDHNRRVREMRSGKGENTNTASGTIAWAVGLPREGEETIAFTCWPSTSASSHGQTKRFTNYDTKNVRKIASTEHSYTPCRLEPFFVLLLGLLLGQFLILPLQLPSPPFCFLLHCLFNMLR